MLNHKSPKPKWLSSYMATVNSRSIYVQIKILEMRRRKKELTRAHIMYIICIRLNKTDERKSEMNNDDASSFLNNVDICVREFTVTSCLCVCVCVFVISQPSS